MVLNELLETVDGRFLEREYIPIFIDNEHKGIFGNMPMLLKEYKPETFWNKAKSEADSS